MVLVSDKPSSDIGILQTKISDRERHEARHVGLEAMPLHEDIEGRHREGQARLKIGPAPMHDLFEMADERQHREHRLHQHTVLPLPPLTQFEIGGIAFCSMEAGITQDNHPFFELPNQPLEGVIDVSTTILSSRHFSHSTELRGERVTAQRKPPEVRICKLRNQSRVGTVPPSTST